MIGVAYAGCDYVLAVCLLILAVGCTGAMYGGIFCNHIDLAPNFAGLLLGLTNTLATLPGFISVTNLVFNSTIEYPDLSDEISFL